MEGMWYLADLTAGSPPKARGTHWKEWWANLRTERLKLGRVMLSNRG